MGSDCRTSLMVSLILTLIVAMAVMAQSSTPFQQEVYVVHMGAKSNKDSKSQTIVEHNSILASILGSVEAAQEALLYHYQRSFRGFAARIGPQHAQSLRESPGVVGVFLSKSHTLATTNSWNFLGVSDLDGGTELDNATRLALFPSIANQSNVIIGIFDTGYWPESESFHDRQLPPVPTHWKGACVPGENFTADLCNNKVIGARYYYRGAEALLGGSGIPGDLLSARDVEGHGTHTASIAAGRSVANVSEGGIAGGRARGGAPGAKLAIYKVCWKQANCTDADVLAAFDDALADGVDVINLSLGESASTNFLDSVGIGSYFATIRGVTVAASAGNAGPAASTVTNSAPWLLTVASTTTDRQMVTDIKLGDGTSIPGGWSINFIQLPGYVPIVTGSRAAVSPTNSTRASFCSSSSLDPAVVKGAIVVCEYDPRVKSTKEVQDAGGLGVILVGLPVPLVSLRASISMTFISPEGISMLDAYFKRTENPVGLILKTVTIYNHMPAPVVSGFSSRGPSLAIPRICKPDIAAPGQDILAAFSPLVGVGNWAILHGTSMACPHITGIVALLKAVYPHWSPGAIKSAIITTARRVDNTFMNTSIRTNPSLKEGGPFDFGSGLVHLAGALDPGLVYDTRFEVFEFTAPLCSTGISREGQQMTSGSELANSSCARNTGIEAQQIESIGDAQISNLNYPSITVGGLQVGSPARVIRTVTNVSPPGNATYTAAVWQPESVVVTVQPSVLQFQAVGQQMSFTVTFALQSPEARSNDAGPLLSGLLVWSDGLHSVATPLVVL